MLSPRRLATWRRQSRGFTLIEVLVAMLVLMIALLGSIGLKASSLMQVTQANSRAVAAIYAGEMFDRLRANPVRARAGLYDLAMGDATPSTPTTIDKIDLAEWRTRLAQNLPSGNGSVRVNANGLASVTVQWLERVDASADAVATSFTFEVQL